MSLTSFVVPKIKEEKIKVDTLENNVPAVVKYLVPKKNKKQTPEQSWNEVSPSIARFIGSKPSMQESPVFGLELFQHQDGSVNIEKFHKKRIRGNADTIPAAKRHHRGGVETDS